MLARRCLLRLPTSSRGVWHRSATEQSPPLKGWQEDAIQACTDAINGGLSRIGVQLMPGESNQILSPVLMDRIPPSPKNLGATRLLFVGLSPNRAEGYAVHMQRYGPAHWHIEVDRNEATAASQADVLLTTYKDMEQARVIKRYDQSKLKAIILDQAHRPKPAFYDSLRRSLESRPDVPQPVVIGMFKSFEDELSSFFQSIVFRRDVLNTFQENWECSARFLAVPAPLGLRNINMAQTTHASNALSRDEVVESTVHAWRDMAATRKTTLVYCVDLRHARKLGTAFQEAGIVARILGFPGTIGERMAYQATLSAFRAGEFPILLVHAGDIIDVPSVDCVVLASPTVNSEILGKMILPGMKASPETQKEDTLIIEVVDMTTKATPVYDIRDLLHLETPDIDGQPLDVLVQRAQEKRRPPRLAAVPKDSTPSTPRLRVEQLPASDELARQDQEEEKDNALILANVGKRKWTRCAPGVYVHDCFARGHAIMRASKSPGSSPMAVPDPQTRAVLYEAYWSPKRLDGVETEVEARGAKKLSDSVSIEKALPLVDKFPIIKKSAPTIRDKQRQATAEQQRALRGFWPETLPNMLCEGHPMPRDVFLGWLTVGDASTALARLRYNADWPDLSGFTFKEQTVILARMRAGKQPWEEVLKVDAEMEQTRMKKRARREQIKEAQKLRKKEKIMRVVALKLKQQELLRRRKLGFEEVVPNSPSVETV